MSSGSCANCGAALAGPYCHRCGQHDSASHPTTVGHLVHELTHELLHVDGKIWRTAAALFTRPGTLTQEYWNGRRVGWIGPFRIFLIAAGLHALLVTGIGPMNMQTLVQRMPDGELDVSIGGGAERRRGVRGGVEVGHDEAAAYVGRIRRAYLAVRYSAVPIFALVAFAVYRRRQPFYAGHVVLAVHFYSFWYLVSVVTSALPYRAGLFIGVSVSAVYLVLLLRRLFGDGIGRTLAKAAVLYAAMLAIELVLALAAGMWAVRSSA